MKPHGSLVLVCKNYVLERMCPSVSQILENQNTATGHWQQLDKLQPTYNLLLVHTKASRSQLFYVNSCGTWKAIEYLQM